MSCMISARLYTDGSRLSDLVVDKVYRMRGPVVGFVQLKQFNIYSQSSYWVAPSFSGLPDTHMRHNGSWPWFLTE
jgi:hypothetical protein